MLTDILSPAARKTAYTIAAVVGVLLGAVQVGFASAEAGQPTWLTVALAVYAFGAGALGFTTARANTPPSDDVSR